MNAGPSYKTLSTKIKHISRFLKFYFKAKTLNNIHSPFLFDLLTKVSDTQKNFYNYQPIETIREKLKVNDKPLVINDLGAGSSFSNSSRTIASVVKQSTSNEMKCRFISNLVRYFKPKTILELGTNLGIATSYLSVSAKNATITTVEGDKGLSELALSIFNSLGLDNIRTHNTSFKAFLKSNDSMTYEMCFIDGDHTYEGTIYHFEQLFDEKSEIQVLVFDDIHWSDGMKKAWTEIRSEIKHGFSIDIFAMGILVHHTEYSTVQHLDYIPRKYKPWKLGLFG